MQRFLPLKTFQKKSVCPSGCYYASQCCIFCIGVQCNVLRAPSNGKLLCTADEMSGSTCTLTCDPCYVSSGAISRTCRNDGTWSGGAMFCSGTHSFNQLASSVSNLSSYWTAALDGLLGPANCLPSKNRSAPPKSATRELSSCSNKLILKSMVTFCYFLSVTRSNDVIIQCMIITNYSFWNCDGILLNVIYKESQIRVVEQGANIDLHRRLSLVYKQVFLLNTFRVYKRT